MDVQTIIVAHTLWAAHKLIWNTLPISAIVGKVKLALNIANFTLLTIADIGKVKLAMNIRRIVDLMPLNHTHSTNTHTQET